MDRTKPNRLCTIHHWIGTWNNLLLLPVFTIMVLETSYGERRIVGFERANLFFCVSFVIEWTLGLAIAQDRRKFLVDPHNIADFVSSIPFGLVFQSARAVRLLRLVRIARLAFKARRFRGRGAQAVRAVGLVAALTFSGALALRIVEPSATTGFFDALWWSIVTLSTVGYGDIMPITPEGKVVGTLLILAGIGTFGYAAGMVTTWLRDPDEDEVLTRLTEIDRKLAELNTRLGDE